MLFAPIIVRKLVVDSDKRFVAEKPKCFFSCTFVYDSAAGNDSRCESFHRAVARDASRREQKPARKSKLEKRSEDPLPVRQNGSSIKIGTTLLCNPAVLRRPGVASDESSISQFLLWEILIVATTPA